MPNKNLVRVYTDRTYVYTTMVRHQGTTVAFAMDDSRRIYYNVLNLDMGSRERGEIDSSYWDDNPPQLMFPSEVTEVGFGGGKAVGVPAVKLGGRAEVAAGMQLQPEDLDPFLSTTARLGAQAPFQVVSDGRYLLLFRQSVDETHPDALFRLTGGGASGDASRKDYAQASGANVPLVSDTVLCDRFVQVGATVKPVLEVRYRRSRSKTSPASSGDTLGTRDLDGNPFYETTRQLSFVRNVTDGEFAVMLLPTQVDGVMRWQLFAVNRVTGRIDAFNFERADDGLFNLAGTQFYTSPDPRYAASVLEREPGADPFTKEPLVPVALPTDRAGTALRLDGKDDYLDLGSAPSARLQGAYTVEAWVKPAASGGYIAAAGDGVKAGSFSLSLTTTGALVLTHPGTGNTLTSPAGKVPIDRYTHVAAVFSTGTEARGTLYVNGGEVASAPMSFTPASSSAGVVTYVGARPSGSAATGFFSGDVDEVRIWSQARTGADLARDVRRRLAGVEPGMVAYYRFDEGAGASIADHTDNGFDGTVRGGATWLTSGAPVGDSPGLSRETFGFAGRSLAAGLAAVLYFQQEETVTGYADQPSPAKRQARVLLACPTVDTFAPDGNPLIATLDLALAADGRLAQVPRSVALSTVGRPNPTNDMDVLSAAQAAVTAAQAMLVKDQALIDQADQAVQGQLPNYQYWNNRYWGFVNSGYCYDQGSFVWPHDRNGRASSLLGALNSAGSARDAALQTLADAQAQLIRDQGLLVEKEAVLAALSGGLQGGDDVALAMPVVAVDNTGLSIFGAILAFAWSHDTPVLLDSATGEVVLYFRGVDGQFFSVYYDVTASRAVKQIKLPSGRLQLTSRDTGVDLPELSFTVSGVAGADLCTVVVTRTANNTTQTETFNEVPRRADQFAAVLNGTPTGDLLGVVASVQGSTVTLAAPLAVALAVGTSIRVAGAVRQLKNAALVNATTLTLTTDPAPAPAGAQVRTVVYNYASASSSRPGARLDGGSLIVAVGVGATITAAVPNGAAVDVMAGRGNHWRGHAPGRSFSFDGTKRLALPAAQRPGAAMVGDLTVEAWANPGFAGPQSRIVHAHLPGTPTTRYTLGVSGTPYPSALEFNGSSDYLDCGTGIDLTGTSFTIEFWAKRGTTGRTDFIVCLGTTAATDKSLHVGFRDNNAFTMDFYNDSVDASTSYSDLNWHHWACVYDREGTNRIQIIYRDGVEVARDTAIGHFAGTGKLVLGLAPIWGYKAYVQFDEMRIWGRARSAQELKADKDRRLTGREADLLGYWNFPGRRTTDLTGRGNDATIAGNPRVVGSTFAGYKILAGVGDQLVRSRDVYPAGQWGHLAAAFEQDWALRFDGAAWLDTGRADALDITGDLTIEVFLRLDTLGNNQGLVCKGGLADGAGGTVSYAFYVQPDGALAFTYENTASIQPAVAVSTTKLSAGVFTRVAVTRRANPNGSDIQFFVNGASAGTATIIGPAPTGNDGLLEIGRYRYGQTSHGLRGVLSEVRLWNVAREAAKIGVAITESTPGLVAQWTFPEDAGNTTVDVAGSYSGRLHGASWVKTPDPGGNRFRLYQNGDATPADPVPATEAVVTTGYGPEQFTVGGCTATNDGLRDAFAGALDEIRVWQAARTGEQILDNVFTRLRGESEDLVCYYPFDASSTVIGAPILDAGPRGNNLTATAGSEPVIVLSMAPVSADTAEVRSALTGIRTTFHEIIGAAPSVAEYADAQRVPHRGVQGVMKRCYSYQQDGRWHLITGYKVGNLVSKWVGQAQFDPQLVGYIEGAPPVPSENLVKRPGTDDYVDASTVSFVQAEEVTNTLSSSKEISMDVALKLKFSWEVSADVLQIAAPLGVGIATPLAKLAMEGNLDLGLEFSNGWTKDTEVSEGSNTTRTSTVALSGAWEDPNRPLNPAAGQRWVPANTGYALVQSETADVFALRLAHTGALVAYRMMPNPDIPRDWNIIEFQINPLYTKQGTLDGLVGYGLTGPFADPTHYPTAGDGAEYSYFKPRDAYALKRRIERQAQQLQSYYDSASTETHASDRTAERAREVANRSSARRNLANTYVWTAGGGFFAESTETTDTVTETTSGSYSIKGTLSGGGMFEIGGAAGGTKIGFEASIGGGSSVTRTRAKSATKTFGIEIGCTGGRDLQRYQGGETPVYDPKTNQPVTAPGRVDAYRFMTFYLDVTKDNFEDFYGKVVDPLWLATSPQAAALRQANQADQKPPCWRVFHRVTFVSRLLDPIAASDTAPASLAKALQREGFGSIYDLIQTLEPDLRNIPSNLASLANLTAATTEVLKKKLFRLSPYAEEIIVHVARYFGIDR
ncbi:LamG domain-containing protein [Micromonospora sp. RTGN7]|uniref:LamG domain-containing protein n=1 Tax=Micromonospora sp. RTGN7 TaxID=3016526 RepID=UPI0029FF3C65|nr:LamG domain-containing protein [Micromonospora sp. RTGN7]